ncbi:hypothetical protein SBRY_20225 [Actinacidiphila bryophytorum]|uniref:GntR family transcriptional regulator n=1 Tax=Actinacidiphila bryophytorum TaxID=1436133 RepID=A0A9W4EDB2_9ACTN|nr:hypothetical protein SBRY_20225 [Actinacidiphila bryophytorum]
MPPDCSRSRGGLPLGRCWSCCRGPAPSSIRAFAYTRSRDHADTRTLRAMDLDRSKPVWPQVAAELRRRLDAGQYPAGERFPAVNELAAEMDGRSPVHGAESCGRPPRGRTALHRARARLVREGRRVGVQTRSAATLLAENAA